MHSSTSFCPWPLSSQSNLCIVGRCGRQPWSRHLTCRRSRSSFLCSRRSRIWVQDRPWLFSTSAYSTWCPSRLPFISGALWQPLLTLQISLRACMLRIDLIGQLIRSELSIAHLALVTRRGICSIMYSSGYQSICMLIMRLASNSLACPFSALRTL